MKNLSVEDVSGRPVVLGLAPLPVLSHPLRRGRCRCLVLIRVNQNEVLLAASPVRPVTTHLPVQLLLKTVPIYSRSFFREQFAPTKSVVKGWQYVRTGVYWCARALDKGAKGGRVWRVDVDGWREGGKRGEGWQVPVATVRVEEDDVVSEIEESGSESDADADEHGGDSSGGEDEEGEGLSAKGDKSITGQKRKRGRRTTKAAAADGKKATPRKKQRVIPNKVRKPKRLPHPTASSSHVPIASFAAEDLPSDPYDRALRLLHVGATPDSLPCREEEFVDVLSRVEEGVETGGGGCLCECIGPSPAVSQP
jgi:origin recognition complex subunit 1